MQKQTPILLVESIEKRYNDFHLQPMSFSLSHGTVMGLIGENGAGKTTIINIILHLTKPSAGQVLMFGYPCDNTWCVNLNSRIGVVFEYPSYPDTLDPKQIGSVLKAIFPNEWNSKLYHDFLDRFGIPENRKIKQLSKGMSKLFHLSCALSHNPDLLILDELTSGIDPIMRSTVLDVLRDFMQDETHSILLSTHYLEELDAYTALHNQLDRRN